MGNIEIDSKFVEEIYINKRNSMTNIARRRMRNIEMAEDATQNAMEDICKYIGKQKDLYNLDAWVYTILKHKCYRGLRNTDKIEYYPEEILENIVGTCETEIIDKMSLSMALESLNEEERQFVFYKYIYGLNYAEIAEKFGYCDKTVSKRTKKALQKLNEILK